MGVIKLKPSLGEQLDSVWRECRESDWDCYNALPVTEVVYRNAVRFLREIAYCTKPPDSVGAIPDGSITFDWYKDSRHTLTVSVGSAFVLHYAMISGDAKEYGSAKPYGEIPSKILGLITRVYK